MKEIELYEPMRLWLKQYLRDRHPHGEVITVDCHNERLDLVLAKYQVVNPMAVGIDIQIDVLGIVKLPRKTELYFIEAKKTQLTIRDLGQLWAYCKLVNPSGAFLLTSANLGGLNKILNVYHREDMLDFGDGRTIKKMQVGIWDVKSGCIAFNTLIPKVD
ncbi:MAG: hypothetical protein LIP02_01215 [Bacteroidales bacterium]|nr:hypothetical protein [Bacteroidales bacterium]